MAKEKITVETISKKIQKLQDKNDWYSVIYDVLEICAITLSNQVDKRPGVWDRREEVYKKTILKYNEAERDLMAEIFGDILLLLSNMSMDDGVFDDYLGKLYMSSGVSNKKAGQYFTPYNVSRLCAEINVNSMDLSKDIITINEPTCGSGGMVLAMIESLRNKGVNYAERVVVICSDIDMRCVYMTYLQLSLAGVPAIIYNQNSLNLETWDEWYTPGYLLNYLKFKNAFNKEA